MKREWATGTLTHWTKQKAGPFHAAAKLPTAEPYHIVYEMTQELFLRISTLKKKKEAGALFPPGRSPAPAVTRRGLTQLGSDAIRSATMGQINRTPP
ncbi:hypothetical protein EVAR_97418_1 [Eumeta japonica]|uniref:Uncharacterized protein n=1 Tax=Eumeta variegata TaxID=151549 RepID=A0A4C1X103_EUMVA|nr:hypothetical protein EVAR_97418_1 [Eumeta japonica]